MHFWPATKKSLLTSILDALGDSSKSNFGTYYDVINTNLEIKPPVNVASQLQPCNQSVVNKLG